MSDMYGWQHMRSAISVIVSDSERSQLDKTDVFDYK
jgi:hypothetical protein